MPDPESAKNVNVYVPVLEYSWITLIIISNIYWVSHTLLRAFVFSLTTIRESKQYFILTLQMNELKHLSILSEVTESVK